MNRLPILEKERMYKHTYTYTHEYTHMDALKVIDELIKEAKRINVTRIALKQLGFSEEEIGDLVEHFVIEKIKQPMED